MLDFSNLTAAHYKPFPYFEVDDILSSKNYLQLSKSYPALNLFKSKKDLGEKFSLSEYNNPKEYRDFIKSNPEWMFFYKYIKSEKFTSDVFIFLKRNHVYIDYLDQEFINKNKTSYLKYFYRKYIKRNFPKINARFEFSIMPSLGGHILPHTDERNKIVTLVIYFPEDDWDFEWGGGTALLEPKNTIHFFNPDNRYAKFEEFNILHKTLFSKNKATIFIKTHNSWHCLFPMDGCPNIFRRTLTINIELV